jgi:hypothetical protein
MISKIIKIVERVFLSRRTSPLNKGLSYLGQALAILLGVRKCCLTSKDFINMQLSEGAGVLYRVPSCKVP